MVGMLLAAAGQPLLTDDLWWHLSLGEAYAAAGPWLSADPSLHTAAGPPAPAAWLADLTLYSVERVAGFPGLRLLHALLVAAILGMAWSALRRASGSAAAASLGTAMFGAVAAYRLFQFRPELFTLLAVLLLLRWLLAPAAPPAWRRVAAAAGLMALWANLHAGFVLGPALLGAAIGGLVLAGLLRRERRARDWPRARRLAVALAGGLLGTLANPTGYRPHLLYFTAGDATPDLGVVMDEWAPLRLFELPLAHLPPTPLSWIIAWILVLALPWAVWRSWRRGASAPTAAADADFDPALVAVAVLSLAAPLVAVRFLWLAIFPLLVIARAWPAGSASQPHGRQLAWAAGIAGLLLAPAFARYGAWPMIGNGVHAATYHQPYYTSKYTTHAVWFLRDSELAGNLFNDYSSGNFLGYWLSPRLRTFINGSLNVPRQVMTDGQTISRRGWQSDVPFTDLLDRYDIDVFFGTGEPTAPLLNRPEVRTTSLLERTPGWVSVFRDLRSGVYLRDDDRANLARAAAYYEREGVPFDLERGFEVERVLREAPRWAVLHGVAPVGLPALERSARTADPMLRSQAQAQLAAVYAALGLYGQAEKLDRAVLTLVPESVPTARRLVWSLLQQGRCADAREAAEALAAIASPDEWLSQVVVDAARNCASQSVADARALAATLPVFTRDQGYQLVAGSLGAEARPRSR